ncbi:MAG TPA: hypothetical protein VMB50_00795, partial [Myxococcales bacterium]|nr:hypothetical protein [Myxococcales bacterium]
MDRHRVTVALALALLVGTGTVTTVRGAAGAAPADPGPLPPPCSTFDPHAGLNAGCIEQGVGGLSIEPKVVHVGQD